MMSAPYTLTFVLNGMEFTTEEIESETEMLQKRETLKSVAESVSVNPSPRNA